MEIHTTQNKGTVQQLKSTLTHLYLFFLLILIASCKHQSGHIKHANAIIDSTINKLNQEADSFARAITIKKIYLTFDDGPNIGTMNVLQTVQAEKIPVSFFVVGKHVFDSRSQTAAWQELKKDSTLELCNHSFTHASGHYIKYYSDSNLVINDFEKTANQLGLKNKVARMPGRNAWRIDSINHTDIKASEKTIDAVHRAGFAIMGWDIEWTFDHKTFAPDADIDLLLRQIQNKLEAAATRTPGHLVLLAHDQAFQKEEDLQKLKLFFQQLKNNPEYELVLASTYPGVAVEKEINSSVNAIPLNKK